MADTLTAPARGLGSLGRHELHRVLQRGRHAVTYEARDVRGAAATVTTLPVDLPGPPWLRMFEAGRFVCFPAVLEQGEAAGLRYVVTAPVQGESCEQLLARQGPLAPSIAARIVLELCRDFETAGSELPLHRALSAESVWLWRDEHGHWHCQLLLTTLWERWLEDVAHDDQAEHDSLAAQPVAAIDDEVVALITLLAQLVGHANIVASPLLADLLEHTFEPGQRRPRSPRELVELLTPLTRTLSGPVATGFERPNAPSAPAPPLPAQAASSRRAQPNLPVRSVLGLRAFGRQSAHAAPATPSTRGQGYGALPAPPQPGFDSTKRDVGRPEAPSSQAAPSVHVDEEVQVSVFRPKSVLAGRWYRLLCFVHVAERRAGSDDPLQPMEQVRRLAQAALGEQVSAYRSATEDTLAGLPEGGQVTLVPEVEGVEFNPPSRSFAWFEDIHQESFQLRASPGKAGATLRGSLSAYLGTVLLAEVGMSFKLVASEVTDEAHALERARSYRKIFASYSHADARIVTDFAAVVSTFGDRYLSDVRDLRAGEEWSPALERLIDGADVFQLFWSKNSMYSPFCRQEWEYALQQGVTIRPVYWEEPMPRDAVAKLPPPALGTLHFARFGGAQPEPPRERAWPIRAMSALALVLVLGAGGLGVRQHAQREAQLAATLEQARQLELEQKARLRAAEARAAELEGQRVAALDEVTRSRIELELSKAHEVGGGGGPRGIRAVRPTGGGKPAGGKPTAAGVACAPGDPLCVGFDAPPARKVCFVARTRGAPPYPEQLAPLYDAPGCSAWRGIATYQAHELPPPAREAAARRGCSTLQLYACDGAIVAAPFAESPTGNALGL